MAERLRFYVHNILTQEPLGELDPYDWKFNDPVTGRGSCEMKIAITNRDALRRRTNPKRVSLYIRDDEGRFYFGGYINYRSHQPGDPFITVKAPDWRVWLDWRLYREKVFKDNYEQYQMAYDLIAFAVSETAVTPRITLPPIPASGVKRQFTVQPGWSVGKALDSFASRAGAFEWRLAYRDGSNLNPEIYFELFEQGQARSARATLSLDYRTSQNNIAIGDITEDATESITRGWAVNDGTYPDRLESKDNDPALASGDALLFEAETTASGVTDSTTLYDYASALRNESSIPFTTLPVSHWAGRPDIRSYQPGDRARLIIRDEWDTYDIPGVRIADRAIAGGRGKVTTATVVLDMTDVKDVA